MFIVRYLNFLNKDEFLRKLVLLTIFLSVSALIFSLIALKYGKLNKEKYKDIDSVKEHQILIQEYSSKILKYKANLLKEEKNAFNYFLLERLNSSREPQYAETKYCNSLKLSLYLSVNSMKPIIDRGRGYLKESWKTEQLIEKYNFNNISKIVDNLQKQFAENYILTCKKNELKNILSSYAEQKHFYDRLLYLIKELKIISSKRLKDTFKDLDENYQKTRNLIIIAFITQLIIFIILNFIDISRVFRFELKK
jgi:hypothetical protein